MAVSFYVPVPAMCVSAAGIFVIIFITMAQYYYTTKKTAVKAKSKKPKKIMGAAKATSLAFL